MNIEDNTEKSSEPPAPRSVKRGAFPTPQSEKDRAPVFVPPGAENEDRPESGSDQPPADPDNDEDHRP